MNDDDLEWLLGEFALTAERAKDRGIRPDEFLIGLSRYGEQLMDDYSLEMEESL